MHPPLRVIAPVCAGMLGLAAVLVSACFDFDATMAGGPLAALADGAASDADIGDAASDAGPDAVSAVDAGPYCASIAHDGGIFFCDDFDEAPLPGSWGDWAELSGTLVDTDASYVSPPRSIVETTQAVASGQAVDVALRTPLGVPTVPATLRFSFALQPVQIDTTANAAIVLGAVDFLDGAGDRYTVALAINVASGQPALALGEQSGVVDGGNLPDGAPPAFVNHPLSPTQPLAMNAWTELVVEIDWTSASVTGKVTVAGAQELEVPLTMTVQPTALQIGVGTSFVTEYATTLSPVWELRYDNVLFTAE